jgi:ubiquitin thioesterase OTU1
MVRLVILPNHPTPTGFLQMFLKFLALHALLQEKNYSERVMLIYDGLHYDALAVSFLDGILLIEKSTIGIC